MSRRWNLAFLWVLHLPVDGAPPEPAKAYEDHKEATTSTNKD